VVRKHFGFHYVNAHCLPNELPLASISRGTGDQMTQRNKKWKFAVVQCADSI